MKKQGVFVLIVLSFIILAGLVAAQNQSNPPAPLPPTDTGSTEEAYQCLTNLVADKEQSSISLQEAIFGTLALGSNSKLTKVIEDNRDSANCWPKGACTVKETAQVMHAYNRIKKNTKDIETWLSSRNKTATELDWYLEIDIPNHLSSSCTVEAQGIEKTITINEDASISGNPGSCFTISSSGYWLRIKDNCMDETFKVSCDQDFVTSLVYQRQGSQTIYVSPIAHSAASLGETSESVSSKCFSNSGNSCDYEGTLWAALAFNKKNSDISSYLPYLLALAEENKKYLPSSFLYILTHGNDQYSTLVQLQQQSKYWQAPNTPYNRFYDTALALLSLQDTSAQETANAESYLLSIQTEEGCWNNNNIRDTAFLLYAGWSKAVSASEGAAPSESCIATGKSCVGGTIACTGAGGIVVDADCDIGVCCTVAVSAEPCALQNGVICSAGQVCGGTSVASAEGSCCLSTCEESQQQNSCQIAGGGCYASCLPEEQQVSEQCSQPGFVCCLAATSSSSGSSWLWIIFLILLIALVILAIFFRNKIKLALFKLKNK